MRRDAEKGSALLIVFVFAAIVAIMLYTELPVAAFEAKRRKEQITIDHGKEYAHAVKLFVRKIGRYPASLDEMQNMNNMRFLRHKFKDPLTGQDDWRLLHAGPGGVLLDSKVKPATATTFQGNTQASGFGTSNGTTASNNNNAAQDSANAKANSGTSEPEFPMAGSIAAEASASTATVPSVPQRPPAVAANAAPGSAGPGAASPDENPGASLVPPIPGEQADASGQAASSGQTNAPGTGTAENGQPVSVTQNAQQAPANGTNGQPGENQNAQNGQGQNTASNMQNMLNRMTNGSGQTNTGTSGTFGGTSGGLAAGGIAGVAIPDKVTGSAIKTVHDQHKYQLWEFYYDPTQDTLKAPTGGAAQPAANNGNNSSFSSGGNSNSSSSTQNSPSPGSSSESTSGGGTASSPTPQSPPQ